MARVRNVRVPVRWIHYYGSGGAEDLTYKYASKKYQREGIPYEAFSPSFLWELYQKLCEKEHHFVVPEDLIKSDYEIFVKPHHYVT